MKTLIHYSKVNSAIVFLFSPGISPALLTEDYVAGYGMCPSILGEDAGAIDTNDFTTRDWKGAIV
jgi:hypothetical protein